MSRSIQALRAAMLAGAATLLLAPQAQAAGFNVPNNTNDTTAKTVGGGDTGTVGAGATLSSATAITWALSVANTAPVTINNSGSITGATRGIDTSSNGGGAARSFTFNNLTAASVLTGTGNDGWRINNDIGAGTVKVNNAGTIQSAGGQALDFAAISSSTAAVSIANAAGAFIQSSADDAMHAPGAGTFTVVNDGTIQSTASAARGIDFNPSSLSGLVNYSLTNGSATNGAALISSGDDALRIAGTAGNTAYKVSVDNFGTISSNSGQAIDFDKLGSGAGKVTITNEASGVIQSNAADGVRPGNASIVNNYGLITGKGDNDGIDFQSANTGTVNNFAGGSVIGTRHGITGDLSQTINNSGIITGQAGSGINIDSISGTTFVTNSSTGVITGTALTGDGDGIDVDNLVNVNNSGTIQAVGVFAGETNEALAIGGGTVTNNAGGLIISSQRAITVDDSNKGNAFGAISIDNSGTITGQDGEAIKITSTFSNTLTNRAGGIINGSVAMGGGDDVVTLYTGSTMNGALDGGAGNDTLHLQGSGTGTLANVSNVESLKIDGGAWTLQGSQSYSTIVSGALGGNVTNNGTLKVNGPATFNGTFQNNGGYISDPSTQSFNNLSVGTSGYIKASAGDVYKVAGDFTNTSTQNTQWDTALATLEFTGAPGTDHVFDITGTDLGPHATGPYNFAWEKLVLDDGNTLQLDDIGPAGGALYLQDLDGAVILDAAISNITGFDGLIIYYNSQEADNAYLGGKTYDLVGGGFLVARAIPEPQSWSLLLAGLGMGGVMLRRRTIKARS